LREAKSLVEKACTVASEESGRKDLSSFLPLGCVSETVACSELQETNVARQRSTVRRKEQKGSSMIHFGRRNHDATDRRFPEKTGGW